MTRSTPWAADVFRAEIQSALDAFVDQQAEQLRELGEDATRLVEAARAAVSGGKRLRASFCYWGFRAAHGAGGSSELDDRTERALARAAAALEMLHASALVHDDYMDSSDTRRGRPASHKAFETAHRERGWRGEPVQYGAAAAILLGDLLLSWSDQLLRRCGLGPDVTEQALRFFDITRSEVVAGQFLDVSVQARGTGDVDQAMQVLRYKSAKYSVERPLHVGAALAGADDTVLTALTAFGLPLGEAFQLRDDLLGVYGDPTVTGKPAGDDLTEGKRTVLVALALEHAAPQDAALLDRSLGTVLGEAEVARLRGVITDSGAQAEVERRIDALTRTSLAALDRAGFDPVSGDALRALAAAATQRAI